MSEDRDRTWELASKHVQNRAARREPSVPSPHTVVVASAKPTPAVHELSMYRHISPAFFQDPIVTSVCRTASTSRTRTRRAAYLAFALVSPSSVRPHLGAVQRSSSTMVVALLTFSRSPPVTRDARTRMAKLVQLIYSIKKEKHNKFL
jgi:hypothetical protein